MENKFRIIWHDMLDSTNDEALRQLDDIDNLSVIAARIQTKGRGQRGNKWNSTAGESLTFTLVMKFSGLLPALPAKVAMNLNIWSALAVQRFLESEGVDARIKWPNDIYVRDRKICGILVENGLDGKNVGTSIIGIGLNLNQESFSPDLPNPVSLCQVTGRKIRPEEALERLCTVMQQSLDTLFDTAGLRKPYLDVLYRMGQEATWKDPSSGSTFKGTISGIHEDGRLLLKTEGQIKAFGFKEIEYII